MSDDYRSGERSSRGLKFTSGVFECCAHIEPVHIIPAGRVRHAHRSTVSQSDGG